METTMRLTEDHIAEWAGLLREMEDAAEKAERTWLQHRDTVGRGMGWNLHTITACIEILQRKLAVMHSRVRDKQEARHGT